MADHKLCTKVWLTGHALQRYNLPGTDYAVSLHALDLALSQGGELPFVDMLHGLRELSALGDTDWRGLEPALIRLSALITPPDEREVLSAAGEEWWIEIGPVDLGGSIITVQRQQELIAALARRGDGRLRLAAYRPLDARSARFIRNMSLRPYLKDGTVCMRENNWEYALDCSAATSHWYAAERGEAYLSYWENGVGFVRSGTADRNWRAMRDLEPRAASQVAVELGVAYAYSTP